MAIRWSVRGDAYGYTLAEKIEKIRFLLTARRLSGCCVLGWRLLRVRTLSRSSTH